MTIELNGQRRDLPDGATVSDAVAAGGPPGGGRGVAVAVDGEVVPRGSWHTTVLCSGRRVEIVQAVGGG